MNTLEAARIPRVASEYPFDTYLREGSAVVRLLKLKDREVTFDCQAARKYRAEPFSKVLYMRIVTI
jgi:hypothetical protein